MKLTPEQKLTELAKLDGWVLHCDSFYHNAETNKFRDCDKLPNYLTSYDAIIPLIQKQPHEIQDATMIALYDSGVVAGHWLNATPSQLSDALLTAHGFDV